MKQSATTQSRNILLASLPPAPCVSNARMLPAPSKCVLHPFASFFSRSIKSNLIKKCIAARATSLPPGSKESSISCRWPMAFCFAVKASMRACLDTRSFDRSWARYPPGSVRPVGMAVNGRKILDQCIAEVATRICRSRGCLLVNGIRSRKGLTPGPSRATKSLQTRSATWDALAQNLAPIFALLACIASGSGSSLTVS